MMDLSIWATVGCRLYPAMMVLLSMIDDSYNGALIHDQLVRNYPPNLYYHVFMRLFIRLCPKYVVIMLNGKCPDSEDARAKNSLKRKRRLL